MDRHAHLQPLLLALPEAMALLSPSGTILDCNPTFARLTGRNAAELRGGHLAAVVSDTPQQITEFLAMCTRTSGPVIGTLTFVGAGESFRCEGGLLPVAGEEACVWVRCKPRQIALQQFALLNRQIEALGQEIAARTRSQEEAREAHERLAFLAQATSQLASSLDYEANLAAVTRLAVPRFADWCTVHLLQENGSLRELVAYHDNPERREQAASWARRYPPDANAPYGPARVARTGRTEVMSSIPDSVLQESARDSQHLEILRRAGLKSYICVPLRTRDTVIGALTLITAESERRYTEADIELLEDLGRRCAVAVDNAQLYEQAVRASSLLDAVLRQMPVGVIVAEAPSGRILFNSEAHHRMMGEGFQPVASTADLDRIAGTFPNTPVSELPLVRALRGETIPEMDIIFLRTDRSRRVMRTSSTPVFDDRGQVIAAVSLFQDVTEKLAADDALRKSEKLAAAGRFAATIAHEINNPLEAATNLLFLVKSAASGEALQYLEMAEHELSRVAQIARKTLGFYKDTSGARTFDLGGVLEQVAGLYGRQAEQKGVHLACDIRGPALVHASEGEMRQVFTNLVSNALDACSREARILLRLRVSNGQVRATVADGGSGIPRRDRERIWEPFFTTKEQTGTGLGLWVTQDLVRKNGGRIVLRSRHGQAPTGSVFTVSMPRAAQVTAALGAAIGESGVA